MEIKKAIIFGEHPMKSSLLTQYRQIGTDAIESASFDVQVFQAQPVQQVIILTSEEKNRDDAAALTFLSAMASIHQTDAPRIQILLLLQNPDVLHLLQKTGFPPAVDASFEVWPMTLEEIWARNLVVRMPGISRTDSPPLDWHPLTKESKSFVHLVICGTDRYAWEVAVQAALVAHFPNYDEEAERPLRTRISFISPQIAPFRDAFIQRYRQLFTHSFYRTVDVERKTSDLHHPFYEGKRKDFVDVEWEFVDASLCNPLVEERISAWAVDPARLLTLVISDPDDAANVQTSLSVPDNLFVNDVPVWVLQKKHDWTSLLPESRSGKVYAFGKESTGLDVRMPLVEMAKLLHYFYTYIYQFQELPTAFPADEVVSAWQHVGSLKMRNSNICNVLTMAGKMRSLGHEGDDWRQFYALSPEEVEYLAKTEHNRWSVERLISGSRPCTDEEREAVLADISLKRKFKKERDAHFDLCAYDELLPDETGRNVQEYDRDLTACIPLLVQSFLSRTRE
jgi:hypothetical protein